MKQFITLIGLILCLTLALASITPSTFEPKITYGGEQTDYNLTIKNDFSYDINVSLDLNFWNESGNFEGMTTLISPGLNFPLNAYSEKKVVISFKAAPKYGFELIATYYLSDTQTPIRTEKIYTGGGTNYIYKTINQDKNVVIEKPVEVIKEIPIIKEVVKEVQGEPIIKWLPQDNNAEIISEPNTISQSTAIILALITLGIGFMTAYFIFKPKN